VSRAVITKCGDELEGHQGSAAAAWLEIRSALLRSSARKAGVEVGGSDSSFWAAVSGQQRAGGGVYWAATAARFDHG
jgi:hypothetical protein